MDYEAQQTDENQSFLEHNKFDCTCWLCVRTEPVAVMLPIHAPKYVLKLWNVDACAMSWTTRYRVRNLDYSI